MRRIVLFLAAILLAGCGRPTPAPEQPADDPSTRTTTDFNPPTTPQEMAQKCDVPIYPGAEAPDDMSRPPHKDTDGNVIYELVLTTKDPAKQVASFYSKALGLQPKAGKEAIQVLGRSTHGNEVMIEVDREGGQTVARIHSIARL